MRSALGDCSRIWLFECHPAFTSPREPEERLAVWHLAYLLARRWAETNYEALKQAKVFMGLRQQFSDSLRIECNQKQVFLVDALKTAILARNAWLDLERREADEKVLQDRSSMLSAMAYVQVHRILKVEPFSDDSPLDIAKADHVLQPLARLWTKAATVREAVACVIFFTPSRNVEAMEHVLNMEPMPRVRNEEEWLALFKQIRDEGLKVSGRGDRIASTRTAFNMFEPCMRKPAVIDGILAAKDLQAMIRATDGVPLFGSKDGFCRAHLISHLLICGLMPGRNRVDSFMPIWSQMKEGICAASAFVGFGTNTKELMDLFLPLAVRGSAAHQQALFIREHNFLLQHVVPLKPVAKWRNLDGSEHRMAIEDFLAQDVNQNTFCMVRKATQWTQQVLKSKNLRKHIMLAKL